MEVFPIFGSPWVSDIIGAWRRNRVVTAWRLSKLGWTQAEIGERLGVARETIRDDLGEKRNFSDFATILGLDWNDRGLANVAKRLDIRIADAWAIALEEYNDKKVFKKLEWKIRTWNNWAFNACDSRFGEDWPGRIPAQLVVHTLIIEVPLLFGLCHKKSPRFPRGCSTFPFKVQDV